MGRLKATDVSKIGNNVVHYQKALRKREVRQVNCRAIKDMNETPSLSMIIELLVSETAQNADKLLYKLAKEDQTMSVQDFLLTRNYLLTRLQVENSSRAGIPLELTVEHIKNATHHPNSQNYSFTVIDHKGARRGVAHPTAREDTFAKLKTFVDFILPEFFSGNNLVNLTESEATYIPGNNRKGFGVKLPQPLLAFIC